MTTPRSPHEDDDFRQLTGAFDRSIAPSPRFAEELKARLEKEKVAQETSSVPAPPVSQRTARAGSAQPVRRRKWLDVAIAAALIVAMLGGSFWYAAQRIGDDGSVPPVATRYAAQPLSSTPITVAESTDVESDPGNINAWPTGFDPDADLDMTDLVAEVSFPSHAVITGDTMIVQGRLAPSGEDEQQRLIAIDLRTETVLWRMPLTAKREFVTDGTSIYGFFSERQGTDITLMAIDVVDGDMRWQGPTFNGEETANLVAPIETMNLFGPTLVDDQLFFRTPEGEIVAVNAETGEEQWSRASDETAEAGQTMPDSLVSDGRYLYEIDGQRSLRKIELLDGAVVDHIEPEMDESASLAWVFATDQELLVISRTSFSQPKYLHAVSTASGDTLWSQPLGEVRPYVTATEDVVAVTHYVPASLVNSLSGGINQEGLYTSFFDLRTGEPMSQVGPSPGGFATLSSSGNVVCINAGVTITCTDTASDRRTLVTLPYAPGEGSYDPVMFHENVAIVRGGERGLVIVQPKDAQPQQAFGPLPGDPGNTNAYPETIDLSQTYSAEAFGGAELGAQEMLVVGDDLVFVGGALTDATNLGIANPTLMSRDIATGEHNWSYQNPGVHRWAQQIATDGENVYAVVVNPNLPTTYRLVALDGQTGDLRWETSALHELAGVDANATPDIEGNMAAVASTPSLTAGDPVIVGNTLLISYGSEILLALDSDTGETKWTLAPEGNEGSDLADIFLPIAPLVANETTAFRSLPTGAVQGIEIATGEISFEIGGPNEPGQMLRLSLHLHGDQLVVIREFSPEGDQTRTTIDVHNLATGEGGWTLSTSSSLGDVVLTDDMLIVVEIIQREASLIERIVPFFDSHPRPDVRVLGFDLAAGDSVDMFDDAKPGPPPAISASGDAICLAAETVRCLDRDGNEMVVDGYEVEIFMPGNSPVYWNGRIIVGNGMGPLTIAKPGP